MNTTKALFITLLVLVIFLCKSLLFEQYSIRQHYALSGLSHLPPQLGKIAVLEFQGVFADYLFLNTLTFMGDKAIAKTPLTPEELQKAYVSLNLITDLDPWADDPYVLAETTLPWEGGMVTETNELLLKSLKARPDNYRTYLFLWFNHFHFLNDPDTAGTYLEKASELPGAPPYIATLAARMKLYAGKLEQGILFLEALIAENEDPNQKEFLRLRQEAMKRMLFLEKKVQAFKSKTGRLPAHLHELIDEGLLTQIPPDPYGGQFYLLENGRVNSTSNLVLIEGNSPSQ